MEGVALETAISTFYHHLELYRVTKQVLKYCKCIICMLSEESTFDCWEYAPAA